MSTLSWLLLALLGSTDVDAISLRLRIFGCGGCCAERALWLHFPAIRDGAAAKLGLEERLADMQACYPGGARSDESHARFTFTVSADGRASKPRFDARPTKASRCVARVVKTVRWAPLADAEPMADGGRGGPLVHVAHPATALSLRPGA